MVTLKKFNLDGAEVGTVEIEQSLADATAHSQLVKDYVVALRANVRQWSANTKGRSEVNHTTRKPHPQKGGGRSRQGSLAAPQYKGGGCVFGPKPKFDVRTQINQKEKRLAIAYLLAEKIREGKLVVVDSFEMNEPKTKKIQTFLKMTTQGWRPLFLLEGIYQDIESEGKVARVSVHSKAGTNMKLSVRNIPNAEFHLVKDVNGYDIMCAHEMIVTESALHELSDWLLPEGER